MTKYKNINRDNKNINNKIYDVNQTLDEEIHQILNKTNNKCHKQDKEILVLSGGSTKGVAQLGALYWLKKNNYLKNINTIAATSAGSMIGMLYIIGYNPLELFKFIKMIDLEKIKQIDTQNIITNYGFDTGDRMMLVLSKLMNAKNINSDITFNDLFLITKMKFIVTGVCVNEKKVYYFSYNNYPHMKVLDAVRISISIPIMFTPVLFDNKIFIDGACIDNFPIHIFDNDIDRVLGIYVSEKRKIVHDIKHIDEYLSNVIDCLFEGIVHRDTINNIKTGCIINITCSNIGESIIDISSMFDEGYNAAKNKFPNINAYIK